MTIYQHDRPRARRGTSKPTTTRHFPWSEDSSTQAQAIPPATGYGSYSHDDYLHAASIIWGQAGHYAATEYQRINEWLFGGELQPLPIVIGITAYGRCIGLTRSGGSWDGHLPRITLASNLFGKGHNEVTDTLVHEMVHARLILAGLAPDHNAQPWCDEITRLSPLVLGHEINARPVNPRRINGKVARRPYDGCLDRKVIARWPHSLRRSGWDTGDPIHVETY